MASTNTDLFSYDPEQERKASEYIHQHRTWFIALGAALVVLGVIAALSSITTTFVSMLFLSGVLLIGGVIRFVSAFSARDWSGSLLLALAGALYVVAGILTFRHPIAAALALTLLFAALFMALLSAAPSVSCSGCCYGTNGRCRGSGSSVFASAST